MICKILLLFFTFQLALPGAIGTKLIIDEGLVKPVWLGAPPKDTSRIFILEKDGQIRIYDTQNQRLLKKPFLDIRDKVTSKMNEQGLLGMAFEPTYHETGRFYLYITNKKGDTEILRCEGKGNKADKSKLKIILTFKQTARNHNGGWIDFGPDNALYIGSGDGGAADDPKANGQDLGTLLGKLLRINVIGEESYNTQGNPFVGNREARPEIYAFGLRNPWRCHWDMPTKQFYIADVGQNLWEEINCVNPLQLKGANFGWRINEGFVERKKFKDLNKAYPKTTDPVYVYKHGVESNQGLSITGGVVYRGSIEELQGMYFFSDWNRNRTWSLTMQDGKATNFTDWTDRFNSGHERLITTICSYGVDAEGEVYLISHDGRIHKIVKNSL